MRNLVDSRVRKHRVGAAVGPGWGERDGFIAWVERATNTKIQRLNAGSGDDYFGGGVDLDAMQLPIVRRDRTASGRQAGVLGVEREALVHRADGRLLNVIGRRQVGFAEVEAQYAIHGHGDLGQFADARARNLSNGGGDGRHRDIVASSAAAASYNGDSMSDRFRIAAITDEFTPDFEDAI